MECHDADKPTHAKAPEKPSAKFHVTWHGKGEDGAKCLQCHGELNEAPLLEVEVAKAETRATFRFPSTPHGAIGAKVKARLG